MITNEQRAIRQWLSKPEPTWGACGCLGPQDGEPVCPCEMKMVEVVDGVYYRITEHRSPDGITHTAEEIKWIPPLPERILTSTEQLQERLKQYKAAKEKM